MKLTTTQHQFTKYLILDTKTDHNNKQQEEYQDIY